MEIDFYFRLDSDWEVHIPIHVHNSVGNRDQLNRLFSQNVTVFLGPGQTAGETELKLMEKRRHRHRILVSYHNVSLFCIDTLVFYFVSMPKYKFPKFFTN